MCGASLMTGYQYHPTNLIVKAAAKSKVVGHMNDEPVVEEERYPGDLSPLKLPRLHSSASAARAWRKAGSSHMNGGAMTAQNSVLSEYASQGFTSMSSATHLSGGGEFGLHAANSIQNLATMHRMALLRQNSLLFNQSSKLVDVVETDVTDTADEDSRYSPGLPIGIGAVEGEVEEKGQREVVATTTSAAPPGDLSPVLEIPPAGSSSSAAGQQERTGRKRRMHLVLHDLQLDVEQSVELKCNGEVSDGDGDGSRHK